MTTYLFILGTGRCGSTLVHEVLARHPDVGFVSNVDDRAPWASHGRWNNALYRRIPPGLTRKGRVRYAPSEGYRVLGREVSPILSEPLRDLLAEDATPWLAARLRAFFEQRAAAQGHPVFVHKFTGWPRSGFLSAAVPEARFIHVVRDGRAVANSWLQMPWWLGYRGPRAWHFGPLPLAYQREWESSERSFVLLAGLAWKLLIDAYDSARALAPPEAWLEVRYEDILADPRARFGEMLSFAGLPWNDRFEEGFRAQRFSSGRRQAFERDLDAANLDLLNRSLGGHLRRLGYDPADREQR